MNILRILIIFVVMLSGGKAWAGNIVMPSGMTQESEANENFYNKIPAEVLEKQAEKVVLKRGIATMLIFDAPIKTIAFGDQTYIDVDKSPDSKSLLLRTYGENMETNLIVFLDRGNGNIQDIHFDVYIKPKKDMNPDFLPTRKLDLRGKINNPFATLPTPDQATKAVTVVPQALLSKGAPKSSRAVNQVIAAKNGISLVLQSIDYYDNGTVLNVIVDNKSQANLDMSHRSLAVYDEAAKKLLTTKTYTDTSMLYAGKQRLVNIVIEENIPGNVTITMPYDSSKGINITGSAQIGGN
jgi:hypothetical protein